MPRNRILLAFAALALSACGRADFGDCAFTCAASDMCPSGQSCVDGFCRTENASGACVAIDATVSQDAPDRDAAICWPFTPSSFDACALSISNQDWTVDVDTTIDTTQGAVEGVTPPVMVTVDRGPDLPGLLIIAARDITVASTVTVRASGDRALILVATRDVMIGGSIDVSSTGAIEPGPGASSICAGGQGGGGHEGAVADDFPGAGGGGGGGFGGGGGDGGEGGCGDTEPDSVCDSDGGALGPAGAAEGTDALAPLRAGCQGGKGGITTVGDGGFGGFGGGALQVTSASSIVISGPVDAGGGGGAYSATSRAGGGGGGSGGAILLEAISVSLGDTASLCANGGGGGGVTSFGDDAEDGSCALGDGSGGGVSGGDGATIERPVTDGAMGTPRAGGGGGGGGVGRIHLRGATTIDAAAFISPPAVTD